jgi:hypothetical protein
LVPIRRFSSNEFVISHKGAYSIQLLNLSTAQLRAVVCHREHHRRADRDQFTKRVSIAHTRMSSIAMRQRAAPGTHIVEMASTPLQSLIETNAITIHSFTVDRLGNQHAASPRRGAHASRAVI